VAPGAWCGMAVLVVFLVIAVALFG